ncbi:YkvA family protein [Streptomyces sp. NPDC006704]|uniref:YkvA family protein n=1 Tax=Streptomyces sp. NPDC006704 TaxID=3364760 RepID=UPI0036A839BE
MSTEVTAGLVLAGLVLLAAAVAAVVLTVRLVRARKILRDAGIPLTHKAAFWGALAYVISPVDLLPDPVYLDDVGVLLLALRVLHTAAAAPRGSRELGGEWAGPRAGRPK